jgi:hypothetical protein
MDRKELFIGIGVAIGLAFGLIVTSYVASASISAAALETEKRYQESLLQHYVKKDLKSELLQVILVASPRTVQESPPENIDAFDSVLSKDAQARLNEFGLRGTGTSSLCRTHVCPMGQSST